MSTQKRSPNDAGTVAATYIIPDSEKNMAYDDIREWIAALERAGELKRVRSEVDPYWRSPRSPTES